MIGFFKKFFALLLMVWTIAMVSHGICSAGETGRIRAAFTPIPGFQNADSGGRYSGYVYSYLQAISQYTRWNYEFYPDGIAECLDKLAAGELDVMAGVERTARNEELFDFCATPIGMASSLIVVKDDSPLAYEDFDSFQGLRIAIPETAPARIRAFERYQAEQGFQVQTVACASIAAMTDLFQRGEVDGMVVNSTYAVKNARVIARFAPQPLYFAVTKGNTSILRELESAVQNIKLVEPRFDAILNERFFGASTLSTLSLSKREKVFLAAHPVIHAVYDPAWAPLEYADPRSGAYRGIVRDIFQIISERTGLQFQFQAGNNFEESVALFNSKKADLLTVLSHSFHWAEAHDVYLSKIFLRFPVVMISGANASADLPLAMSRGYHITLKAIERYPHARILQLDSIQQCFDAVLSGKARGTLVNSVIADYCRSSAKYDRFRVSAVPNMTEELSIAVSRTSPPELLSILNKGIGAITDDEIMQINHAHAFYQEDGAVSNLVYRHTAASLSVIAAIFAVLLLLLFFAVRSKNRKNEALMQLRKKNEIISVISDKMNVGLRVCETDGSYALSYSNHKLAALLGYSPEDFTRNFGGTLLGAVYPPDLPEVRQHLQNCIALGSEYSCEYRIMKKDGSLMWAQDRGRKFLDKDGVTRLNSVITDITPLKNSMEILRIRAETDELTGLFNKSTFYRRASELMKSDPGRKYLIATNNVDRLKIINERCGINAGNRVLQSIAQILRNQFSERGVCARLENDHFAVCCPWDSFRANALLEAIGQAMGKLQLNQNIIVNFGVYAVESPHMPVDQMCDRANLALESVKGQYFQRCAYYEDSMRLALAKEQELTNEMRPALKQRQFQIYLQPQVNHATGALEGCEALVRWLHPQKGLIPPSDFIPVFEMNGFIAQLDEYVWEEACKTLRRWLGQGRAPVPISVNMSRLNIYNSDLCDRLCALLHKYGLPPELLRIEITESAYVENSVQLIDVIERLQKIGFFIEMDDFGSGYSSLNTLKDVPFNLLKLDMKFLQGDHSARSDRIISSIVRMARDLKLEVLAEGVETLEQADYLLNVGCPLVQGYYYSNPLPVPEFEAYWDNGDGRKAKSSGAKS